MTSTEKSIIQALDNLTKAVSDVKAAQDKALEVLKQLAGDSPPYALSEASSILQVAGHELADVRSQITALRALG